MSMSERSRVAATCVPLSTDAEIVKESLSMCLACFHVTVSISRHSCSSEERKSGLAAIAGGHSVQKRSLTAASNGSPRDPRYSLASASASACENGSISSVGLS